MSNRRKARATRAAAGPKPPPTATYWLTRDRAGSKLSRKATAWLALPRRIHVKLTDLVYWTCDAESVTLVVDGVPGPMPVKLGAWREDQCPTFPDDDMQCVRVGTEVHVARVAKWREPGDLE